MLVKLPRLFWSRSGTWTVIVSALVRSGHDTAMAVLALGVMPRNGALTGRLSEALPVNFACGALSAVNSSPSAI